MIMQYKYLILLIFTLAFLSCSDENTDNIVTCEDYRLGPSSVRYIPTIDKPNIITEDSTFLSFEVVSIEWSLPNDLKLSQFQSILLNERFECEDYDLFHQLPSSRVDSLNNDYSNQLIYNFGIEYELEDTVYLAYRIRSISHDRKEYSEWTEVRNVSIVPVSNLELKTVSASYDFNIVTEEIGNEYYSGIVNSDALRLEDHIRDNYSDIHHIIAIRPKNVIGIFETRLENNKVPFTEIVAGFEKANYDDIYPFDVLAGLAPGTFQDNPIEGVLYPFGGIHRNLLGASDNMILAYELDDEIGRSHKVVLKFSLDVYFL